MINKTKKNIVLFALFIVPLLFYVFLQLGTHNFGKLPIVSKNILDVSLINKNYTFKNKVSVVAFAGDNFDKAERELYNLNEKVYKKFYGYTDIQFLIFLTELQKSQFQKFKDKISINTNLVKWNVVYASKEELNVLFNSFKTGSALDENAHNSEAFIIDKEGNVRRGKSTIKDKEKKELFGYNMKSVAELKNDLHDDVKVVLAEYSFALKKNNVGSDERRKKSVLNEKK